NEEQPACWIENEGAAALQCLPCRASLTTFGSLLFHSAIGLRAINSNPAAIFPCAVCGKFCKTSKPGGGAVLPAQKSAHSPTVLSRTITCETPHCRNVSITLDIKNANITPGPKLPLTRQLSISNLSNHARAPNSVPL